MPIEYNIFLASHVRLGRTLSSGSISFIRANTSVKLVSDHPLPAFKLYNFNTADNLVNFAQPLKGHVIRLGSLACATTNLTKILIPHSHTLSTIDWNTSMSYPWFY